MHNEEYHLAHEISRLSEALREFSCRANSVTSHELAASERRIIAAITSEAQLDAESQNALDNMVLRARRGAAKLERLDDKTPGDKTPGDKTL